MYLQIELFIPNYVKIDAGLYYDREKKEVKTKLNVPGWEYVQMVTK